MNKQCCVFWFVNALAHVGISWHLHVGHSKTGVSLCEHHCLVPMLGSGGPPCQHIAIFRDQGNTWSAPRPSLRGFTGRAE